MICILEGCDMPATNRRKPGLCHMHAERLRLTGDVRGPKSERERIPVRQKLLERRLITAEGCWEWTRGTTKLGYGLIAVQGDRSRLVHRVAYEEFVGPVPEGLSLDHLCRNPPCFNPLHLEPVTHQENVLRGKRSALREWPTHCQAGHPFDEGNTAWARGRRVCRACAAIRNRRFRARQKEQALMARDPKVACEFLRDVHKIDGLKERA